MTKCLGLEEILLLAGENAISPDIIKKWNNKYPFPSGKPSNVIGQAKMTTRAIFVCRCFSAVTVAFLAAALLVNRSGNADWDIFPIAGAVLSAIGAGITMISVLLIGANPQSFVTSYGRFLSHCNKRSGDVCRLDEPALARLVEEHMIVAARSVLSAEEAARSNPNSSLWKKEENDARERIKDMYDTFLEMGLVPDPKVGYTPYFKKAEEERRAA